MKDKEKTLSPWIYHQLSMTTMLRERKNCKNDLVLEHASQYSRGDFAVEYDVSELLKGLKTLTDDDLIRWNESWKKRPVKVKEDALDELYKIVFPK